MDSRVEPARGGFILISKIYVIAGHRPGNPVELAVA